MSKEHRPIAVIQEELDAAINRRGAVRGLIERTKKSLETLKTELRYLVGGIRSGGHIGALTLELEQAERLAERLAADMTKPTVVWKKRSYDNGEYVVAKVTEKLIFVRRPGEQRFDRFLRDGSSPSRWSKDQIDIRQTFGINADVLPDDFRFSEKTK